MTVSDTGSRLEQSGAGVTRFWQRLSSRLSNSASAGVISWLRELLWPRNASKVYAFLALVAVAVPWAHRYPAGIDLPMHVNLFQVLANYSDPEMPYRVFYRLDFYTPYAVVYLLGWFFAEIGGPLFAIKVVLTLCILTVPACMTRWLRVIGGDTRLGMLGFALVFGYGYQWGFVSYVLSAAVSFAYLAELGELLREPSWRRRAVCAALAVLLFFTHGIAFGFTMVAGGLICVLRRRKVKTIALDFVHYVPAILVVVPWRLRQHEATSRPFENLPDADRFTTLFSGAVSSQSDFFPGVCGLAATVVFLIALRPRLNLTPERVLPWALGLLGLFTVPDSVSDTFLVGTRFVQFVYFFGAGAVDLPRDYATGRRVRGVVAALALLGSGTFHYRMAVFNREFEGFERIRALVRAGSDIHFKPGNGASAVFGSVAHRCVSAYIPAQQGGLSDPDNTHYFQIPVQHRTDIPGPGDYPYWITRGTSKEARSAVGAKATPVASYGLFHLYETQPTTFEIPGLSFVRYGQNWSKPRQDRSVTGGALQIDGQVYGRGIGTHAQSVFQFHPRTGMRHLRGKAGMDDGGHGGASAVFRITDGIRRKLFERVLAVHAPAAPFDVSLEGIAGDVFFVVVPSGNLSGAHADWVDVEAVF